MTIPWGMPAISSEEFEEIKELWESNWLSMGPKTREFENNLCKYVGVRNAIMVNNGTSALLGAFLSTGIMPGDYVIAPTYTFIATINVALSLGARVVLVDADPKTFNITPSMVEDVIKKLKIKPKVVVAVDVAGLPIDVDGFQELAARYGFSLIEDAAEALGGEYKDKKIGGFGHLTTLSFHAAKQLTTIEGGAILTNDDELAERLRIIRSHGEDPKRKYWHKVVGLNLRPTDFQASIGLVQLRKFEDFLTNREKIAAIYKSELKDLVDFQAVPEYVTRHPYMIFFTIFQDSSSREKIIKEFAKKSIGYRIPWPPAHIQPCSKDRCIYDRLLNAEKLFRKALSLPMFNTMKVDDAFMVTDTIKKAMK